MRILITICLIYSFTSIALSQDINHLYKWQIQNFFAYEKHDKRLYEWRNQHVLLNRHPEEWGTYWFGISINRNFLQNDYFKLKGGITIALEKQTFERPYQPAYLYTNTFNSIYYTYNYKLLHLQLPLSYELKLFKGLYIEARLVNTFSLFKIPSADHKRFTLKGIDYYSTAFHPGIKYYFKRFGLGIDYRIYQYKKIDPVIYTILFRATIPPDPRLDIKYEKFNPTHIGISFTYSFNEVNFINQK